jgi:tRNA threonylcarbamoyl adenosine modification protein (Sua5/YciO/YrdC/YwlC family)
MLLQIHPENPGQRQITNVAETLSRGGIVIYPTDTVYGMGCDIKQGKAIEKVARIKGVSPKKPSLSFIFSDISQISAYTRPIDNSIFKLLKRNLPGAFTFILNANNQVPKLFKGQKKTIGIRIPDCNIIREIVRELGRPVLSTSIHDTDEIIEYTTDPELIYEKYQNLADIVINGGYGKNEASTIVDCTMGEPQIIRQGLGILEY